MLGSQALSVGLAAEKSPAAYREDITSFIWKILNSSKHGMCNIFSVT